MKFRPISAGFVADLLNGGTWPKFVRDLKGKSGVYVIRASGGGPVLYVGESHTRRLYDTFTRHFQSWTGKTAGPTYGRGSVEVAFEVSASAAVERQNALIVKFQPRDNELSPAGPLHDEDPF